MTLSVVMAGRNDDYGGGFLYRVDVSMEVLAGIVWWHNLSLEVVFVEWNPPEGRTRMRDAVVWPPGLQVRVITVPREAHDTLPGSDRMPMLEFVAKNVGIRRASGEIILATNPDILLSDRMGLRLGSTHFNDDDLYRACRYDLDQKKPPLATAEEILAHAASHVEKVQSCAEAAGDFLLMTRAAWQRVRGSPELPSYRHLDSYTVWLAQHLGMRLVVFPEPIYHQSHDRPGLNESNIRPYSGEQNGEDWGLGNWNFEEWEHPG